MDEAVGVCRICGAPLPQRRKLYCSEECKREGERQQERERSGGRKRKPPFRLLVCPDCGRRVVRPIKSIRCEECQLEADARSNREHKARKRAGMSRKLGELYPCEACGALYQLDAGLQRYCPQCAQEQMINNIRAHKRAYNRELYGTEEGKLRKKMLRSCAKATDKTYTGKTLTLRDRLAMAGLSQTDVAGMIGVTQSGVSCWVLGKSFPTRKMLEKLAIALRCEPQDLERQAVVPKLEREQYSPLAKRRMAAGLLQRELAKQIGVCMESISLWETGKAYPQMSQISALAQALSCTREEIRADLEISKKDCKSSADTGEEKRALSKLALRRKAAGLTQREIAEMIGIKGNTYTQIETGRKNPSRKRIGAMARVLNCTTQEIMDDLQDRRGVNSEDEKGDEWGELSPLARRRKKAWLTQKELGERIGVGNGPIMRWEQGRKYPNRAEILALAQVLDCTEEEIYADLGAGISKADENANIQRTKNKIAQRRIDAGLSQREMANRAGIVAATYCNVENGRKRPTRETIEAIARVLLCTPEEIMEDLPPLQRREEGRKEE